MKNPTVNLPGAAREAWRSFQTRKEEWGLQCSFTLTFVCDSNLHLTFKRAVLVHQSSSQLPKSYQRASTSSSHPSRAVKKAPNQQNPHDGTQELFLSQETHRHRGTQRKTTWAEDGHEGRTLWGSSHTRRSKGSQPSKRQPSRKKTGQQSSCRTAAQTQRCQGHWAATVPQQATLRIWHSPSIDDGTGMQRNIVDKRLMQSQAREKHLELYRQIENVGGVNSAREQDSSVGGDAAGVSLGAVHMEGRVQVRVQVEVGREEQGEGETHGESQNEEQTQQTVNRSSWMAMNMVWCANAETWAMWCDSHDQTRAKYRRKMAYEVYLSTDPVAYSGSPSTVNETNFNKKVTSTFIMSSTNSSRTCPTMNRLRKSAISNIVLEN